VLHKLGYGISLAELTVMGWGGLRGAVGLALAIVVDQVARDESSSLVGTVSKPDLNTKLYCIAIVSVICLLTATDEWLQQDEVDGSRVVFLVGGFAVLTLLVNGMTTSWLLARLGLVGLSGAKKVMLDNVRTRIAAKAKATYR
jgi:NhaP-type Na+/H+ or K+/H+ antiporter